VYAAQTSAQVRPRTDAQAYLVTVSPLGHDVVATAMNPMICLGLRSVFYFLVCTAVARHTTRLLNAVFSRTPTKQYAMHSMPAVRRRDAHPFLWQLTRCMPQVQCCSETIRMHIALAPSHIPLSERCSLPSTSVRLAALIVQCCIMRCSTSANSFAPLPRMCMAGCPNECFLRRSGRVPNGKHACRTLAGDMTCRG